MRMISTIFLMSDWQHILLGDVPWYFLLEVWVRTAGTYLMLMLGMRLLGKQAAAQYTLFEMSAVITLSSAIGSALVMPDNGMLPPFVSLVTVVFLHKLLLKWRKKADIRLTVVGKTILLVKDNKLLIENMERVLISQKKIFEILRLRQFQHLGQISRLYLESSGSFSIVATSQPKPGLSILPASDEELQASAAILDHFACSKCGNIKKSHTIPAIVCASCGAHAWTKAVLALTH